jgi:hypothetical protein
MRSDIYRGYEDEFTMPPNYWYDPWTAKDLVRRHVNARPGIVRKAAR